MSTTAATRQRFDAPGIEGSASGVEPEDARRAVRMACLAVLGIVAAGLIAIPEVNSVMFSAWSLFYQQYAEIEGVPLVIVAVFALVVFALARWGSHDATELPRPSFKPWIVALCGVAVVGLALAGIHWFFHGYFLADDEYSAWFQALIFARGRASASVPPDWCRWIAAITPTAIHSNAEKCTWRLSYLPIHSLMQAPFIAAGVGRLGVPLLSGLSVLLTAAIARKLWPSKPMRAYVAAFFMVTSTQVLFMSMTMFSMVTHLFFCLIWLWLYVDDRRWSNVVLPWVGVAALGVHSPFPHALFVPPFVLRYLWKRRFAMFAYVSAVYAFGLMYWYGYLTGIATDSAAHVASFTATAAVSKGIFSAPSVLLGITAVMHLALIASWNAPVAVILVVAAILSWKQLDTFCRDATLSVALILIARLLMPTSQGEGWGYRYAYDALAAFALLSAVGFEVLASAVGARRAITLAFVAGAAALVVQLPLRAANVERIVGPYQRGFAWIESLNYDAVLYPTIDVLWGRQLVQNDPFLRNRPIIVSTTELSPDDYQALVHDRSKRVYAIPADSIRAHGFLANIMRAGSLVIQR